MKLLLALKDPDFNDAGFGFFSDLDFAFLLCFSDSDDFGFFQVRIQGFSVGFRISEIWFLGIRFKFFGLGWFRFFQVLDLRVNFLVFRLDLVVSVFLVFEFFRLALSFTRYAFCFNNTKMHIR